MHPMLPGTRPLSRSSAPIVQREEKKRKVLQDGGLTRCLRKQMSLFSRHSWHSRPSLAMPSAEFSNTSNTSEELALLKAESLKSLSKPPEFAANLDKWSL